MRRRDFLSFAGLAVAGFAADPSRVLWSPLDAFHALHSHWNPQGWWQPYPVFTDGGLLVPPGTIEIPERVFANLKVDTRAFNLEMNKAGDALRRYIMKQTQAREEVAFLLGPSHGRGFIDATS